MAKMTMKQFLDAHLQKMLDQDGSDLHFKSGSVTKTRISGDLEPLSNHVVTREQGEQLARELMGDKYEEFTVEKDVDFLYEFSEKYSFRANMFYQKNGVSVILRVIPTKILSLDDLKMPKSLYSLADVKQGLICVVGVTGSGKSTTLAAIINEVNVRHKKHILTLEDPIEFVHPDKGCNISQRSVGQHSKTFSSALKGALRQDPDIILVGEMRDIETIELALHAAETGHLVFSTLHTMDAKETVNRIISVFPPEEQPRVRITLASVLAGVVAQRLVKTLDGKRAAALEVLLNSARVTKMIIEEREADFPEVMDEGYEMFGTQSFDFALAKLIIENKISVEVAKVNATVPSDINLRVEELSSEGNEKGLNVAISKDDAYELKTH